MNRDSSVILDRKGQQVITNSKIGYAVFELFEDSLAIKLSLMRSILVMLSKRYRLVQVSAKVVEIEVCVSMT